jgi:hypothetical protein
MPPVEVGDTVDVEARMGAGSNKEGGTARVTKVHADGSLLVRYVLESRSETVEARSYESGVVIRPHRPSRLYGKSP